MDSDDRFYGASQSDEALPVVPGKPREMTAWWLACTIVLTILAAMVAMVLVILCALSFILFELAATGRRWGRFALGGDRAPQSRAGKAGLGSDCDLPADHRPHF